MLLLALVLGGLSLVWALRTKDHAYFFASDLPASECFVMQGTPVDSRGLREGRPPPANWERNERLEGMVVALQGATEAYPATVSACTSTRRALTALGSAIAIVVLLSGLLFARRRRRLRHVAGDN